MSGFRLQNALERANLAISAHDMEAAASALSEARLLAPDHAGARRAYIQVHANLAAQRLKRGDAAGAKQAAETALQQDPAHMDALINAAAACVDLLQTELALNYYERALAIAPFDAQLKALRAGARLAHSQQLALNNDTLSAHRIASLDSGVAHALRQLALPFVYRDQAHLLEAREHYRIALESLEQAPSAIRLGELQHQNFLLAYQALDDLAMQRRYGDWLCQQSARFTPKRAPVVRGRVGLLSSFWRLCTVGSYFASWIDAIKAEGFEVEVYQLGPEADAFTTRLIAAADRGAVLKGSIEHIAEEIAGRGLDLLIYPELGMDGRTFALASMQLARVQLCAWGHPVTTGLPSIDHFFSCAAMEPEGFAAHYREHVIALPGLGTCYVQPPQPAARSPNSLGLPLGSRIFIGQSPFKLLPDNDARLCALAHAAPTAQFIAFESQYRGVTSAIQERMRSAFKRADLNPDRLHWQPLCSREQYLQIAGCCDIALDSLGFSGGNTSLDCLSMGLPLLTSPGQFMRGRQSHAMLHALGLGGLSVPEDQLVQSAGNVLMQRAQRKLVTSTLSERLQDYLSDPTPLLALRGVLGELIETR